MLPRRRIYGGLSWSDELSTHIEFTTPPGDLAGVAALTPPPSAPLASLVQNILSTDSVMLLLAPHHLQHQQQLPVSCSGKLNAKQNHTKQLTEHEGRHPRLFVTFPHSLSHSLPDASSPNGLSTSLIHLSAHTALRAPGPPQRLCSSSPLRNLHFLQPLASRHAPWLPHPAPSHKLSLPSLALCPTHR